MKQKEEKKKKLSCLRLKERATPSIHSFFWAVVKTLLKLTCPWFAGMYIDCGICEEWKEDDGEGEVHVCRG